jgi:hypothetical protein
MLEVTPIDLTEYPPVFLVFVDDLVRMGGAWT